MQVRFEESNQFGLGIYEVIAVEHGKMLFYKEHLDRLFMAAEVLGFTRSRIERELDTITGSISAEIRKMAHGSIRIMVTRENVSYSVSKVKRYREKYENGYKVDYSKILRNETSPLVYYKTNNMGDSIVERKRFRQDGIDDTIFLNTKGNISATTNANIFVVTDGQICTPPKEAGVQAGIVHSWVIENYDVVEKDLTPEDLEKAEECFLTNSILGIMPVAVIAGKELPSRAKADEIRMAYLKMVEEKTR